LKEAAGKSPAEQSLFGDLPLEAKGGVEGLKQAEGKDLGGDELLEELACVVGPEAAERLCEYYAGSNVYFSKRRSIRRKHRQIREEYKNGASCKDLCVKYGYGERYIKLIAKKKG